MLWFSPSIYGDFFSLQLVVLRSGTRGAEIDLPLAEKAELSKFPSLISDAVVRPGRSSYIQYSILLSRFTEFP